ncbi:probable transcription-associated protein 1 [Lolium rigidum]|uniref:probable transcription-associated protein 1 n=1 Tax=Lolium rigidum TaxID=89674 RepID=UPI001F5C1141|nr:probable transcription-associated protein 1 [Lolium rigidum]
MASFADEGLPPLTPIKTAPLAPPSPYAADAASAAPSQATSTTTTLESAAEEKTTKPALEDQKEPATPTSEESRLRTPEVCPPAPVPLLPSVKRKSRPTSTTTTTARAYIVIPRDLSAVFRTMPPEKRIRAS